MNILLIIFERMLYIFNTYTFWFLMVVGLPLSLFSQQAITYWPNGKKQSEGIYRDGFKTGVWMQWYENGQLSDSGAYVPAGADMIRIVGYDAGCGALDSLALKKEAGKNFSACTGNWTYYTEDGSLQQTGIYLPRGMMQLGCAVDEHGDEIWQIGPVEPVKTGTWKFYLHYNILDYEQEYILGIGKGMRIYYADGKKYEEGYFDEPRQIAYGTWKIYDMNGVCVKEILYDENGKKLKEEQRKY